MVCYRINLLNTGVILITSGKKSRVSDRTAAIAAFVLAFASLYAAIYHIRQLLPLLEAGEQADAIVTEIDRGARNTKWAVYRFEAQDARIITARDLFQLYIRRLHKGDHVTVIYDPSDPDRVTADLGLWVWQGPVIFLSGFVFLAILGILIIRFKAGKENR